MSKQVIIVRTPLLSQIILRRSALILAAMVALSLLALYFSLAWGKTLLPAPAVWDALAHPTKGESFTRLLVTTLRLPRSLVAFMTGGMLATAGHFMQIATKNPIASPTLTGVADGSALGAVFFLAIFSDSKGNMLLEGYAFLPLFAITFGLVALGLVMGLQRLAKSTAHTFILIGVTVAIFCKALTSFLMMIAPIYRASQAALWLSGAVDGATLSQVSYLLPFYGALLLFILGAGRLLQVMNLSSHTVDSIGGDDSAYKKILIVCAGLLSAVAVSFSGPISFIGILVPHLVRKLDNSSLGSLQGLQILLLGGSLVTAADTIGRTIAAPIQIPVGVVTVVVGGIVFLVFFYRKGKKV